MTDTPAAFALKATHDLDQVGAIVISDRDSINVRELLQEGDGYVVTHDDAVAAALDGYDPVKRVPAAEAEQAARKPARTIKPADQAKE